MTTATLVGGGSVRIGVGKNSPVLSSALAAVQTAYEQANAAASAAAGHPVVLTDYISTNVNDTKGAGFFNIANPYAVNSPSLANPTTFQLNANSEVLWVAGPQHPATGVAHYPDVLDGHSGTEVLIDDNSSDTINANGGTGTIVAGNGMNVINLNTSGPMEVVTGKGKDSIVMGSGPATIHSFGVDTISFGGSDTVVTRGVATVLAASNSVQITLGSGAETASVGSLAATLLAGSGTASLIGGSVSNLFLGGGGKDTMVANTAASSNVFQFADSIGGTYTIKHFVHGADSIHLVGYTSTEISNALGSAVYSGGNTTIDVDGTKITLVGYHLQSSDIT